MVRYSANFRKWGPQVWREKIDSIHSISLSEDSLDITTMSSKKTIELDMEPHKGTIDLSRTALVMIDMQVCRILERESQFVAKLRFEYSPHCCSLSLSVARLFGKGRLW
jgi:hypothetical protein